MRTRRSASLVASGIQTFLSSLHFSLYKGFNGLISIGQAADGGQRSNICISREEGFGKKTTVAFHGSRAIRRRRRQALPGEIDKEVDLRRKRRMKLFAPSGKTLPRVVTNSGEHERNWTFCRTLPCQIYLLSFPQPLSLALFPPHSPADSPGHERPEQHADGDLQLRVCIGLNPRPGDKRRCSIP